MSVTEQLQEKCKKYQKHFSELLDINCKIIDAEDVISPTLICDSDRDFCKHCSFCNEVTTHLYGCNEASRWNGKYIYFCPLGLVFTAASLSSEDGVLLGGLVLGPIVMGALDDVIAGMPENSMTWAVVQLNVIPTNKVQHISEILSSVAAVISGVEHQKLKSLLYDQERILKEIYVAKEFYDDPDAQNADSLLQFEKELRFAVIRGEKSAALDMLNEILAHIYVYSNFDIKAIKARMLELLVILSRATIEAGADPSEAFRLSENFIAQIESYNDVDQLAFWISNIIRQFIIQTFDLAQVKHSDVVFKITNYIKKNCAEKLSLDSLAREVYLSKSYLSSIFKQETGMSLTSYITKVRVEKSKEMLREECISLAMIASQCGFKDQSYFTKVFKKETGVSPKKYRDNYLNVVK